MSLHSLADKEMITSPALSPSGRLSTKIRQRARKPSACGSIEETPDVNKPNYNCSELLNRLTKQLCERSLSLLDANSEHNALFISVCKQRFPSLCWHDFNLDWTIVSFKDWKFLELRKIRYLMHVCIIRKLSYRVYCELNWHKNIMITSVLRVFAWMNLAPISW